MYYQRNRPRGSNLIVILSMCFLTASCSSKPSDIEHKNDLYYDKSGVMKLHVISRPQTLAELSAKYGLSLNSLAAANKMPVDTILRKGEVVKIPISRGNNSLEQLGEINIEEISDETIVESLAEYQENDNFDEEIAKDIEIASKKSVTPNNVKNIKKSDFYAETPLSSKHFIWPVTGRVLSHYGKSDSGFNEGINIAASMGTIVKSASEGEVVYVGKEPKVYGNLVIIRHKNNYMTAYAHLDKIIVKKDQKVSLGQPIATVGKTGAVSTPQLNFSVRYNRKNINPEGESK